MIRIIDRTGIDENEVKREGEKNDRIYSNVGWHSSGGSRAYYRCNYSGNCTFCKKEDRKKDERKILRKIPETLRPLLLCVRNPHFLLLRSENGKFRPETAGKGVGKKFLLEDNVGR